MTFVVLLSVSRTLAVEPMPFASSDGAPQYDEGPHGVLGRLHRRHRGLLRAAHLGEPDSSRLRHRRRFRDVSDVSVPQRLSLCVQVLERGSFGGAGT